VAVGITLARSADQELPMLTKSPPDLSRTRRDRVVDAGFHVSVALLAVAIVVVVVFVMHGPR
jgi:hypothetical protein